MIKNQKIIIVSLGIAVLLGGCTHKPASNNDVNNENIISVDNKQKNISGEGTLTGVPNKQGNTNGKNITQNKHNKTKQEQERIKKQEQEINKQLTELDKKLNSLTPKNVGKVLTDIENITTDSFTLPPEKQKEVQKKTQEIFKKVKKQIISLTVNELKKLNIPLSEKKEILQIIKKANTPDVMNVIYSSYRNFIGEKKLPKEEKQKKLNYIKANIIKYIKDNIKKQSNMTSIPADTSKIINQIEFNKTETLPDNMNKQVLEILKKQVHMYIKADTIPKGAIRISLTDLLNLVNLSIKGNISITEIDNISTWGFSVLKIGFVKYNGKKVTVNSILKAYNTYKTLKKYNIKPDVYLIKTNKDLYAVVISNAAIILPIIKAIKLVKHDPEIIKLVANIYGSTLPKDIANNLLMLIKGNVIYTNVKNPDELNKLLQALSLRSF